MIVKFINKRIFYPRPKMMNGQKLKKGAWWNGEIWRSGAGIEDPVMWCIGGVAKKKMRRMHIVQLWHSAVDLTLSFT